MEKSIFLKKKNILILSYFYNSTFITKHLLDQTWLKSTPKKFISLHAG